MKKLSLLLSLVVLSLIVLGQSGKKWSVQGNNTVQGDFLGTKNNQNLVFKTNNTQRMLIQENGLILFKNKVTGEYPVRLKSKLTVDGIALFKDKATFNGIGHFKNRLIADDITRLKSKLIVDSNAVIKGKIRNNYLSGSGIVLLKADNNGNIKKFLFPGDSTKVLRGDGTYGSFSAGITGSENNTVYFNPDGKQHESDALTNDGTDIKVKNNLTVGERSGATGAYSMVVGASAPEYGLAAPEASNLGAFAHGSGTKATGLASFSTGVATKATGTASFTTGINTIASGESSFAGGHDDAGGNRFVVASGKGAFNYSAIGNDYVRVGAAAKNSAILGGKDHSIDTLAENSGIFCGRNNTILVSPTQAPPLQTVIIGGENIIATEANTVYVPDLIAMGSITAENMNVTGQTNFDSLLVNGNISSTGKVIASAYASNSPLIFEAPLGIERARIDDITGNFGIRTTDPQQILHLKGSEPFIQDHGTPATMRIEFYHQGFSPTGFMRNPNYWDINVDNRGLYFINPQTVNEALSIRNNGNVGIGTTNPENKLDVNGSVFIQGEGNVWTSNAHWNVVLKTPLASAAWRSSIPSDVNNKYLGFGMTNSGWYWIMSDADDNTQPAEYPMFLSLSAPGVSPQCQLNVDGYIKTRKVIVDNSNWVDFVFDGNYKRMSYEEKEKFYIKNKHLFGMPSGKQIEKNGLDVGETMKGVTLNVEENRLDITDLHKRLLKLEKENQKLKKEINELKNK